MAPTELDKQLEEDIKELMGWARRYCDLRNTSTPSSFNLIVRRMLERGIQPPIYDRIIWARDGMRNDEKGCFLSGITKEEATAGTAAAKGIYYFHDIDYDLE